MVDPRLDAIERDAVTSLKAWIDEISDRPMLTSDGHAIRHVDGVPVALEVLRVIAELRAAERRPT